MKVTLPLTVALYLLHEVSEIGLVYLKSPEHGLGINMGKKSKLFLKV